MSLADWDTATIDYNSGGAADGSIILQSISPIQGLRSFSCQLPAVGSANRTDFYAARTFNGTCGRVRTLKKIFITIFGRWGVLAQSQGPMTINSSGTPLWTFTDSYIAWIDNEVNVHLAKGAWSATPGGIDLTPAFPKTIGSLGEVWALQLEWDTDIGSGDVFLVVSIDGPIADPNTYDYSTLTPVISYTDPAGGAYSTGTQSGILGDTINGNSRQQMFDVTEIFVP